MIYLEAGGVNEAKLEVYLLLINQKKENYMKKLLIVFAFAGIATASNAQATKEKPKAQQPTKEVAKPQDETQEYVTRSNGKLVVVKGDISAPMQTDVMKFENGNYITPDGVFVQRQAGAFGDADEGTHRVGIANRLAHRAVA